MVTIQNTKTGNFFQQGNTSLRDDKTIQYHDEKSLSSICRCGKPFVDSLLENGIICDTVVCSACESEIAYIVDK